MSLVKKLYNIGSLVRDNEFIDILKTDIDPSNYTALIINFDIKNDEIYKNPTLLVKSLDNYETFFTKAIGGRGSGYFYLYPNFEYQNEGDLYKKFKNTAATFEKSVLVFANKKNQNLAKPVFEYIKNYKDDELNLKGFEKGNYLLVFTINNKTIKELMPEILINFTQNCAFLHSDVKPEKSIDFITQKEELCGYNPDIKFFTFDNYHDKFKDQITAKLPLSQKSASVIKKGWIYVLNNLKFYHRGLEYIIIPSMINFDEETYKKILDGFKKITKTNNLEEKALKEESFIRRLKKQTADLESIKSTYIDVYFTDINLVNLSVKIFGSMENLLPSKIRDVGRKMMDQKICDYYSLQKKKDGFVCLSDYFSTNELFARFKKIKGMENLILQEKIYLAKLLLGYDKIEFKKLLDKFEYFREFDFEHKRKLNDEGIKNWIEFSDSFIESEDKTMKFLDSIESIKRN